MTAAMSGHLELIKWLVIEGKASLAEKENHGATAFLVAVVYGQLAVVQWLLKEGKASLDEKDNYGRSALSLAIQGKKVEVVTYILENHMISYKSLLEAIQLSDNDKIIELLSNYQIKIDHLIKEEGKIIIPNEFICPITKQFIIEPISAPDRQIYEKKAIVKWLKERFISPFTREVMTEHQLYRNNFIERLHKEKLEEIDSFLAKRFALSSIKTSRCSAGFFAEGGGSGASSDLLLTNRARI